MRGAGVLVLALLAGLPAWAGPPFVTDDPEPTETGHWENYLFVESTRAGGTWSGPAVGVELNYGPFPDTQLTASFPLAHDPGTGGPGVIFAPLAFSVKYRFIEEDPEGWRPQVALFPAIQTPVGRAARTSPTTEALPFWAQKSWGPWTAFGGGGVVVNPGTGNRDFMVYGLALLRQVSPDLQIGVESFGQTRDAASDRANTSVGFGWLYDFSEQWHFIGSANHGVIDPAKANQFSYNIALKWTY
jgi:hypothetical protein